MATIYHGTDVSRYQGSIDWPTYAAAKDFVIIKAAGGDGPGLYTDSTFYANQAGARAQAGLRVGYYFFGDRRVDAASAAIYFINTLSSLNSGEILVLDIEGANYPPDDWAYVFCKAIFNNYGFYPFVYMSQFSPTSSSLAWTTTNPLAPFWMANYSLADTDFSQTSGNADSTWDSLPAPNYRILQYSSSGIVAGIPNRVDLDSFYSPNNTLNDWNSLGFQAGPPPPTPGTLTVATVTDPTMIYTQPSKQTYLPTEIYDQVLFSTVFNTSVTSSTWPVNIPGPTTGLTQYAYPIGNYSYNITGTSNLNDFGFINAGDFGQFPGTLPTVVVQPIVASDGSLSFDVTVNNISGSVAVGLVLNIALLAYPNTTNIPLSTVQQDVARSNAISKVQPSAYSTYRRISFDFPFGTGNNTLTHGLDTVPNLLYWVQDNTGTIEMQPVSWASDGHTTAFGISIDSTDVYLFVDAANNSNCWLRLYKDN